MDAGEASMSALTLPDLLAMLALYAVETPSPWPVLR